MDFADTLIVFSTRFLGIFIEAAPFLLIGTLTSGLIEAFLSHEDLLRLIPRNVVAASLVGGLLGFAFPVCECGVVPVTRRLYRKGLPAPVGIAFLLASPVVNPIVIASTYAAFHERAIQIVYLRVIVALVVAVLIGLLFAFQTRIERLLRDPIPAMAPLVASPWPAAVPGGLMLAPSLALAGAGTVAAGHIEHDHAGHDHAGHDHEHAHEHSHEHRASGGRMKFLPGIRYALALAGDEFFEMGRYLILGSLVAASLRIAISQDQLEALATGPVSSVLVMQALAFILSICSTADAFVALDLSNTFTLGSVLGFLTFGPMVDIKSTLMFLGVFKRRVVLYLILLPFLLNALIAIWINLNVRF